MAASGEATAAPLEQVMQTRDVTPDWACFTLTSIACLAVMVDPPWQQTRVWFSPEAWVIDSPSMMNEYRKLMHAESIERTHLQPRHVTSICYGCCKTASKPAPLSLTASAGSSL